LRDSDLATAGSFDTYVQSMARKLGLSADSEPISVIQGYSDYASFTKMGVLGTCIYWMNFKNGEAIWPAHTLADNLDAVDVERMAQVTYLGVELVNELVGMSELPIVLSGFFLFGIGIMVVSFVASSFMRYQRGWRWSKAFSIFIPPQYF